MEKMPNSSAGLSSSGADPVQSSSAAPFSSSSPPKPGSRAQRRHWHLNRRRSLWFIASFLLFLIASGWFCWLQPPPPMSPRKATWWLPIEQNSHRRLPTVPRATLLGAFFTNSLGWVVGDDGVILHTIDAGKSWAAQTNINWGEVEDERPAPPSKLRISNQQDQGEFRKESNTLNQSDTTSFSERRPKALRTSQSLNVVRFVDATNGWAAGNQGTILHTVDGGVTWISQPSHTLAQIISISFIDARRGWAVSAKNYGAALYTEDSGLNWSVRRIGGVNSILSITFVDAQLGWALAAQGAVDPCSIFHTTDGGITWSRQFESEASPNPVATLHFVDSRNGWATGVDGRMLRTVDGGNTWTIQTNNLIAGLAIPFDLPAFFSSFGFVDAT